MYSFTGCQCVDVFYTRRQCCSERLVRPVFRPTSVTRIIVLYNSIIIMLEEYIVQYAATRPTRSSAHCWQYRGQPLISLDAHSRDLHLSQYTVPYWIWNGMHTHICCSLVNLVLRDVWCLIIIIIIILLLLLHSLCDTVTIVFSLIYCHNNGSRQCWK